MIARYLASAILFSGGLAFGFGFGPFRVSRSSRILLAVGMTSLGLAEQVPGLLVTVALIVISIFSGALIIGKEFPKFRGK